MITSFSLNWMPASPHVFSDLGKAWKLLRGLVFKTGVVFLLILSVITIANACDQTTINVTSAIDNGDGTYTYTATICLAIDPNWGATGSITLTADGNIISSSTSSVSTTYSYCDAPLPCNGSNCLTVNGTVMGCPPAGGNIINTTCSAGVMTGGGTLSISPSGCDLAPGDLAGSCADCGNPSALCFDVTFTTDAPTPFSPPEIL